MTLVKHIIRLARLLNALKYGPAVRFNNAT